MDEQVSEGGVNKASEKTREALEISEGVLVPAANGCTLPKEDHFVYNFCFTFFFM